MKRPKLTAATLALVTTACGQVPERTEAARGLAPEGTNIVLVLSVVFIVVSVGLIVGAIAVDRMIRSRRTLEDLADAAEEPEEEKETEVAGIGVGTGAVPKWLYGFYVLIPTWALIFVFTNVDITSPAAEEPPGESPAATQEPGGTTATIAAANIQFDSDTLGPFPAETEVTITFDNSDAGIPHNVAVYEDDSLAGEVFKGEVFNGDAEREYEFTTPAAGTYYFQCDIHPAMNGDFVVEG